MAILFSVIMASLFSLKDFLYPVAKIDAPASKLICFYKYTLYMAPQVALVSELPEKLLKHKRDFIRGRLEFHLGPYFIHKETGELYFQPVIDIDAKHRTKRCLKTDTISAVRILLNELEELNERRDFHVELTSFSGVHLITDKLFKVEPFKAIEIYANLYAREMPIETVYKNIEDEIRSFDEIRNSDKELFHYLKLIRQIVRKLFLYKLWDFKCVDPAGMNYNPFRRFPSRANIKSNRNKIYYVTPLDFQKFKQLSLTEIHLLFEKFSLSEELYFKLINRYLFAPFRF